MIKSVESTGDLALQTRPRVLWLVLETLTRSSFALLLFFSPFGWRTAFAERRIANIYSSYTDFFYYPSDIFLLASLFFGGLAFLAGRRRWLWGSWFITAPLVLILVLSWLGVLTGVDPELTAYHSLRLTALFALYLLLVNLPVPPVWIALALTAGVLVQGAVAVIQFSTQHSIGLERIGELVLDPANTGISIVRDGSLRVLRAYGLTDHPNLLGGFLAFALILILGYYFASAHTRARYLLLAPVAFGAVALVLTFSRAAIIALLVGGALIVFCLLADRAHKRARLPAVAVAGAVVLVALIVPLGMNRNLVSQRTGQNDSFTQNSGEARSFDEREALIASATRVFTKKAVSGVGNGALPVGMYLLDPDFDDTYYYQPAHVVLLEVVAELGIFGGVAWIALTVGLALALWIRRHQVFTYPWLAALAAALVVLLWLGFFDYYPWLLAPGRIWQWSAWGLVAAALLRPEHAPTGGKSPANNEKLTTNDQQLTTNNG
jgi:hypothetical protein